MANLELIAPQKTALFQFSTAPVHNMLCSLFLLNEDKSEITDWITQTVNELTPAQLRTNKLVTTLASRLLEETNWASFPSWLAHLQSREPLNIRDELVDDFLKASAGYIGVSVDDLPTPEALLADAEAYVSIYEQVYEKKGHRCDCEFHAEEHRLLSNPALLQETLVTHLQWMWGEYLRPEWERIQSMLTDSIAAFETLDFSGMSTEDALRRITGRDQMPQIWGHWIATIEQIVMIPSAHIGPFLMTIDKSESTVWLVMRAHIPDGANISSPSLTRSELLMRMAALSNDTRLRILELLNTEGEQNANEIQTQLDLTQSATSRHIQQLFATGYLHQRRLEGVKHYRINYDRVHNTADALIRFLEH